MICHTATISYKYGQTIEIIPFSDVHLGHTQCDEKQFRKDLSDADPESTYFLDNGDLMDSIIVQDVKRYFKEGDRATGHAIINEQINMAKEILYPYRKRFLGFGFGNHERELLKRCSVCNTMWLCNELGATFLGLHWFLRINLSENGSRGRSVIIYGHHGWGAPCRTPGGNMNRFKRHVDDLEYDFALFGHVHSPDHKTIPRTAMSGKDYYARDQNIIICPTYQKTWSDEPFGNYAEMCGYTPVRIGHATLRMKPLRTGIELSARLN